jgi:tetratricopeptide (TPR) repeat protein
MVPGGRLKRLLLCLVLLIAVVSPCYPENEGAQGIEAAHQRGVALARQGKHDEALRILRPLLRAHPDNYPLRRDYIIISSWKGDCDTALAEFARIKRPAQLEKYFIPPVADCAVKRARSGDYDAGLSVLNELLQSEPDSYPLQRDIILITIWKGDCPAALDLFERVRGKTELEPYFVVPVSDCLLERNRPKEALTLVRSELERHPADPALRHSLLKATVGLKVDENYDDERHAFIFELASDTSDQGLLEWQSRAELSAHVAPRTRLYTRYLATSSDDSQYSSGNLDRAGLGIRHWFNEQWFIDQEISTDVHHSGQNGAATTLVYEPRDTWKYVAAYTNFAEEDLPLRARANGVEASHWQASAEYNSLDYVWYWHGGVNDYDFTDSNRRKSLFTSVGYAYEMLPHREQRVYLEWYQSTNTLDDTAYFNPGHDRNLGVVHRTDFVFDSRYKRHVDSLYLYISDYTQDDFGSHVKWGVKYEQDYDFDDAQSLFWGVAYGHNVYDGAGEMEWRGDLRYVKRF